MLERWLINDFIRQRLRRLRKERGKTAVEVARALGLPRTSYVSLESGAYKMKLDHLHGILAFLDADIQDVWPDALDPVEEIKQSPQQSLKVQNFRLNELLSISGARGGLLLSQVGDHVQVHLAVDISSTLTNRILYYLEDGEFFKPGLWFRRSEGEVTFLLYLRTERAPRELSFLVKHYLLLWANFFKSSARPDAADDS